MPRITKIAITGGPCAGKTTALARVRETFSRLGHKVITVPEPATELISNGITPWECSSTEEYQRCQMEIQLVRERMFERAAAGMDARRALIVCDRGMLDNRCYMTEEAFQRVIAELGCTEVGLCDGYGAVFHLVTAAKGAEGSYEIDAGGVRHESLEEARALDDCAIESWTGHPHLRVIGNETNFERKVERLVDEIACFLGDSAPQGVERRFLVAYPDLARLEAQPACERVEVVEHHLRSVGGREAIVCSRMLGGHRAYSLMERQTAGGGARPRRRCLSERAYHDLLSRADPERDAVRVTRYHLTYEGRSYEVDLHPRWDDRAIVRVEPTSPDVPVRLPCGLRVIREMTGDPGCGGDASLPTARGGLGEG